MTNLSQSPAQSTDILSYDSLTPERIKAVSVVAKNVRDLRLKNTAPTRIQRALRIVRRNSYEAVWLTAGILTLITGVTGKYIVDDCVESAQSCPFENRVIFKDGYTDAYILGTLTLAFTGLFYAFIINVLEYICSDLLRSLAYGKYYPVSANLTLMREAMEAFGTLQTTDLQALEASELQSLDDILGSIEFSPEDPNYNELRLSAQYLEEQIKQLTQD